MEIVCERHRVNEGYQDVLLRPEVLRCACRWKEQQGAEGAYAPYGCRSRRHLLRSPRRLTDRA